MVVVVWQAGRLPLLPLIEWLTIEAQQRQPRRRDWFATRDSFRLVRVPIPQESMDPVT